MGMVIRGKICEDNFEKQSDFMLGGSGLNKEQPRLFIVTRMFSGLFESVQEEEWKPSGIPAITSLVERISNRWEITWIVSCKNETEFSIAQGKPKQIVLNNVEMHFVGFPNAIKSGKINSLIKIALVIK